ncbi:NUDIX hydrolase [Saccharothrix sp.]|uniref:NUDIX hydrolase n=1 Tax=Saccharothrix sp. TaxID=1873460 RepID=UPI002812019B|nr:NUDIX hydrolase [Saccharothrix sp.]
MPDDRVLLVKNEREESELPGPDLTRRDARGVRGAGIAEETQWQVTTGPILDTWMYHITVADKNVFIVTYGCYSDGVGEPVLSHDSKEIGLSTESEMNGLTLPGGYKRSIATTWFARLRETDRSRSGS